MPRLIEIPAPDEEQLAPIEAEVREMTVRELFDLIPEDREPFLSHMVTSAAYKLQHDRAQAHFRNRGF